MAEINLPKDMLVKEKLHSLPPKYKEEYLTNLIKKIVELNPAGITLSQISKATGSSSSTIWHHLEILKSTSQCRKISHGNIDVYYPIGTLEHVIDFEKDNVKYSISTVINEEGSFVCIYELRKSGESEKTLRGISIPLSLIENLVSVLNNAKQGRATQNFNEEKKE